MKEKQEIQRKKIKIKGRKDENIEKNRGKCTFEPVK